MWLGEYRITLTQTNQVPMNGGLYNAHDQITCMKCMLVKWKYEIVWMDRVSNLH